MALPERDLLLALSGVLDPVDASDLPWRARRLLERLNESGRTLPASFWKAMILRVRREEPSSLHHLLEKLAMALPPGLDVDDFGGIPIPEIDRNWLPGHGLVMNAAFRAQCLRLLALASFDRSSPEIESVLFELQIASTLVRCDNPVLLTALLRLEGDPRLKEVKGLLSNVVRDFESDLSERPTAPSRLMQKLKGMAHRINR